MAILDTFYILFKSDTSELKKGADEAKKIVSGLSKVLAAALPAAFGIESVRKAINFGVEISKTSRLIGANADELQAWSNAAEIAGGTAAGFQQNLASLAQRFGTSSETILKVLPRYADVLSKLSSSRAQQVGKMWGLDESTILLLQRGRRELDDLLKRQKELGGLTKQDTELFLKYNAAVNKSNQAYQRLNQVLATAALPFMIKFFDMLDKGLRYFVQHKDLVIGGLIAIGAAATYAAIAFGFLSLPIILVGALIAGAIVLFAAIYEDVQHFLNGQKSLIGYLINHYPNVTKVIKTMIDVLRQAFHALLHPLETVEAALSKIYDWIAKIFGGGSKRTLEIGIANGKDLIKENAGGLHRITPIIPGLGGSSNTTTVNTGDINVNAQGGDPDKIASGIIDKLDKHLAQAVNNSADAVVA
jgi:hypothetical protein